MFKYYECALMSMRNYGWGQRSMATFLSVAASEKFMAKQGRM